MRLHSKLLISLSLIGALYACGGGGGGGTASTGFTNTYTSSLAMGEVVDMTVNTTAKTFSYSITKSQYGCELPTAACNNDSGTITLNADGSYTGTGAHSTTQFSALQNGLLVGKLTLSGFPEVQIAGVSNPITSAPDFSSNVYNFISNTCSAKTTGARTNCLDSHGTIEIAPIDALNASYSLCFGDDLSIVDPTARTCTAANGKLTTGAITKEGAGGLWKFSRSGSNNINYLIAFKAPNAQNVVILDFNDSGGYGYGQATASTQFQITNSTKASAVGTWLLAGIAQPGTLVVNVGSDGSIVDANGNAYVFTPNSPFNGFYTSNVGTLFMMAGTGVFMGGQDNHRGYQIGIKIK